MVDAISSALGGIQNATQRINKAAETIAGVSSNPSDSLSRSEDVTDSVELTEAAVEMMAAKTDFKANVATFEVSQELQDELLDIIS